MKTTPILFSAPMVRALIIGSKTQTRRVIKPQPMAGGYCQGKVFFDGLRGYQSSGHGIWAQFSADAVGGGASLVDETSFPYGLLGDQLWVRETHMVNDVRGNKIPESERAACEILYKATDEQWLNQSEDNEGLRWAPSIHMPRWASRLTLKITGIRVERLNDISDTDAIAEGIERGNKWLNGNRNYYNDNDSHGWKRPIDSYRSLWESINGKGSWAANPWVWVIEFEVLK